MPFKFLREAPPVSDDMGVECSCDAKETVDVPVMISVPVERRVRIPLVSGAALVFTDTIGSVGLTLVFPLSADSLTIFGGGVAASVSGLLCSGTSEEK